MWPEANGTPQTGAEQPPSTAPFARCRGAASDVLRKTRDAWPLLSAYERFEQVVSLALTALVSILVVATLVHLTWRILRLIVFGLVDPAQQEIFQVVFGMIMTVLMALEFNH